MSIKPATPQDIPDLVVLVNGAYRGPQAAAGWANEAGMLDGQRTNAAMLAEVLSTGTILIMRDGGDALMGCVSVEAMEEPSRWYLGMLTIDPTRQAAGLGRHLLAAAEAHARERGAERMRITVIQVRDTLIAWYRRRGYTPTGETEPFPYGDLRFGVPLRPDLHFVVLEKPLGADAGATSPIDPPDRD